MLGLHGSGDELAVICNPLSHVQNGRTALESVSGHTSIVKYLVEETTAQVNACSNYRLYFR